MFHAGISPLAWITSTRHGHPSLVGFAGIMVPVPARAWTTRQNVIWPCGVGGVLDGSLTVGLCFVVHWGYLFL